MITPGLAFNDLTILRGKISLLSYQIENTAGELAIANKKLLESLRRADNYLHCAEETLRVLIRNKVTAK